MKKLKLLISFLAIATFLPILLRNEIVNSFTHFRLADQNIRKKRSTSETNSAFTTNTLKIRQNDPRTTLINMLSILTNNLKNANIVKEVNDNHNLFAENKKGYVINPHHNFSFIKVPIILEKLAQKIKKVYLIFDCTNFKLQGYQKITTENEIFYYHFNDATIIDSEQSADIYGPNESGMTLKEKYTGKLNVNSEFKELKSHSSDISGRTIYAAFSQLFDDNTSKIEKQISQYQTENIMLVTLEALKFRTFVTSIINNCIKSTSLFDYGKHYLLQELEHGGKSDELKELVETLEKNQNLDKHILKYYKELILPVSMFKYVKKNEGNDSYSLELKEKFLYYDPITKTNKKVTGTEKSRTNYQNYAIYEFNLHKLNPLKIKKIAFIGDTNDNDYGVRTDWDKISIQNKVVPRNKIGYSKYLQYIYRGISIDQFLKSINNNLQSIIQNKKITNKSSGKEISQAAPWSLQNVGEEYGGSGISSNQKFGLTGYYDIEKKAYYLQLIIYQYLQTYTSLLPAYSTIKIGKGIKLYNIQK